MVSIQQNDNNKLDLRRFIEAQIFTHCYHLLIFFINYKAMNHCVFLINPLMGTLKPQSNGPLYSSTVIGTLAVDGWAATLVPYSEEGPGRLQPRPVTSSV